jgi:hypothetical protein
VIQRVVIDSSPVGSKKFFLNAKLRSFYDSTLLSPAGEILLEKLRVIPGLVIDVAYFDMHGFLARSANETMWPWKAMEKEILSVVREFLDSPLEVIRQ